MSGEESVFGASYAAAYDSLYHDKDYPAECDLVEQVLRTYGSGGTQHILDIGCGTGGHSIPLARRGYHVRGVDRSEAMLSEARRKAGAAGVGARFTQGDAASFRLDESLDAALMLFAVLGYLTDNEQLLAALRNVRRHLRAGGLFIFDVWYGPAVLLERPSQRVKVSPLERGQLLRVASGELDPLHHLCTVTYDVWLMHADRAASHTREQHVVRFFFPQELRLLLGLAGLELARLGAFPEFERDPDESTWNVLGVARAV